MFLVFIAFIKYANTLAIGSKVRRKHTGAATQAQQAQNTWNPFGDAHPQKPHDEAVSLEHKI